MTTDDDMTPRQPGKDKPLEQLPDDAVDFVDETVARITDAEVNEHLRKVLSQAGYTAMAADNLIDRKANEDVPGSPRPGGQAAAIIVMRASTRTLASDLASTRSLAAKLANRPTQDSEVPRTRDLARTIADDLARTSHLAIDLTDGLDRANVLGDPDLARARDLAATIARDLARTRDLAATIARNVGRILDSGDARDRKGDFFGALGLGFSALGYALLRGRSLAQQLQAVLGRAVELRDQLQASEIDACGADLSALDLTDMSVLEGVLWTEKTSWPNDYVKRYVVLQSDPVRLRPGVYRVLGGSERAPAELVIP